MIGSHDVETVPQNNLIEVTPRLTSVLKVPALYVLYLEYCLLWVVERCESLSIFGCVSWKLFR